MKKIVKSASAILGALAALPALAANLGDTVNVGLGYSSVVGWGTRELRETIMQIVNIVMGFLAIIAVVGIVYGGFRMMTAGGNEDQSASGKKAIFAGVIGLAVIIAAYAIASFVIRSLVNATV